MCRSPLAHGVLVHLLALRGMTTRYEVDSAGTWAQDGIAPHPNSVQVARQHGVDLGPAGRSRSLVPTDLYDFDHVLAMDRRNHADIVRLQRLSAFGPTPALRARVRLLRHVVEPGLRGAASDVPDPIGRGPEAYAETFTIVEQACHALLEELERD